MGSDLGHAGRDALPLPDPEPQPEGEGPRPPAAGDAALETPTLPKRRVRALKPWPAAPRSGGSVPDDMLQALVRAHRLAHPRADARMLGRAYEVADRMHRGQRRRSGEPYITHPLAVAVILAELGLDTTTLAAALLHDTVEDTGYTLEQVRADFGDETAQLVDGVTELDKVRFGDAAEAETVRKLIVATGQDLRVLVIKLADRLHNMRTLQFQPSHKQQRIARATLDVLVPLADRLGIFAIKRELEDRSFAVLQPEEYGQVVALVAESAEARDEYYAPVLEAIQAGLQATKVKAAVAARPRHYFSIHQKMAELGGGLDGASGTSRVLIVVSGDVRGCYTALGVVHARWTPVAGRFKDYIVAPKFNVYQSLHTTVVGPGGKPLEVQIRTEAMHRIAEFGVAANVSDAAGRSGRSPGGTATPENPDWLRRLLDWQREASDPRDFMESLKTDLYVDEVFVFTPKGDVVSLPAGATPIDFAYAVHTEVGHRCVGARVNKRLVPLEYVLQNGDTVEIFTSKAKDAGPSQDWLGIVRTPRARTKVRQWFSKERREDAIEAGRDALVRGLRKAGLPLQQVTSSGALAALAGELRLGSLEGLYAAVGGGQVSTATVINRLQADLGVTEELDDDIILQRAVRTTRRMPGSRGVLVRGVEDVWVKLARCCTPVPRDPIIGFVTRGHGVSVHRADCPNASELRKDAERLIDVAWDTSGPSSFAVTIQVEALDRTKLLRDITEVLSDHHVNILSATVATGRDRVATLRFTFELAEISHLTHVLSTVKKVEGVFDAFRVVPQTREGGDGGSTQPDPAADGPAAGGQPAGPATGAAPGPDGRA